MFTMFAIFCLGEGTGGVYAICATTTTTTTATLLQAFVRI